MDEVWQVDLDRADLPMPSEQYDAVVCTEVLEHLYDPEHALAEISRVLARGGRVVVSVPNLAYWRYRLTLLRGRVPPPAADPRHLQQYDLRTLTDSLLSAGLSIVRVAGFGVRFPRLAERHPALFSDILLATAVKIT
jgi:predicted SAM-dependent methyltransferase